jgi:uncharacterized protein
VAEQNLLALILAAEGILILGLMAFNAYFLTQRPVLHYIKEIYFINSRRFRQAWYLVISATTFFFLIHATVFLGHMGVVVDPSGAQAVATIFTIAFGTLIMVAFGLVFSVFIRYVRRLPARDEDVRDQIMEDLRRSLLREDIEVRLDVEFGRVGDVVSERRTLGPHISLSHYRALTTGFIGYMEHRWGHMGDSILYGVGRLAGRHAAGEILREKGDAEGALGQLLQEIRDNGIGLAEIRQSTPDRVDVVVHESAPAAGTRAMGRNLCHYQAGLFAGMFELLRGQPALAKETRCWGLGDRYCEFRIDLRP